jgi:GxxExxY protein
MYVIRIGKTRSESRATQGRTISLKDVKRDCGYRLDLLVEDQVIVKIIAVEELVPIHQAQPLSTLKLSGKK